MREAADREGRTVLYVSHNMSTIRQLCNRCIVLDKGRIIYDGEVEKAVSIYLGTSLENKQHYEYGREYHTSRFSTDKFVIQEIDILNGQNGQYNMGETVQLRVKISQKKKYSNVLFRYVFNCLNGIKAGTMFSNEIDMEKLGDIYLLTTIDLSHLTAGRYRVDIIAFQYDEFGTEQIVDAVYPGIYLEINEVINSENRIKWLPMYGGNVRLHDLTIQYEE